METFRNFSCVRFSISLMAIVCIAAVNSLPSYSVAGLITVTNLNTADVIIPVFDTSLGTLNSVGIEFRLRAGSTEIGGAHTNAQYQLVSTNTRSNSSVGFTNGTRGTSVTGTHTHSVNTGDYSVPGLNLGSFSFSTNPDGDHFHLVDYFYGGLQQVGPSSFRAVAILVPRADNGHSSSFGDQSKSLSFTGSQLAAFLGSTDIVIAGSALNTSSSGSHSHTVLPFSVTASSSTGPWNWDFNTSGFSSAAHSHTIIPRFDTIVTFDYTAVPEPTSFAMISIGMIAMSAVRFRRRQFANVL